MRDGDKIIRLVDRLNAEREARDNYRRMDAKAKAHGFLVPTVAAMRELGLPSDEIAKTLRFVADVIDGKEEP